MAQPFPCPAAPAAPALSQVRAAAAAVGHQGFTEGQESTAGTKHGDEGGHGLTPAWHKAQGKITLSC